ncbi:hypothetical protein MKX03_018620 [Papaver bracteatum]|nr:hypothetical protein MKX03_018620 [Papaver bracteatum]
MENTYQYAWIIAFVPLPVPIAIGMGILLVPSTTKNLPRLWDFLSVLLLSIVMLFSIDLPIQQMNGSFIYQYLCDNYISHDEGYLRFFAYMSFSNTSMLGLVTISWNVLVNINRFLVHTTNCSKCLSKSLVTNRAGGFWFIIRNIRFYWITGSSKFRDLFKIVTNLIENAYDMVIVLIGENLQEFYVIICI